jgi:DNA-binding CsgD family transcriptional regulator
MSDLSSAWQIVILVALQMGAGFLLKNANETGRFLPKAQPINQSNDHIGFGSFWRLLATVFIFDLACRTCDVFTFSSYFGLAESNISQFVSHCVAAGFLLLLVIRVAASLSMFYRFALPCTGAGFILLALPMVSSQALSLTSVFLVGVGFEIINITVWVLISYVAKTSSRPSKYFGCYATVTYAAMFAGRIVRNMISVEPVIVAFVGLSCVVILVIVAFVLLPEQKIRFFEGSLRKTDEANAEYSAFIAHCRMVVERYRLTERESDVLELLARGRTLKVIAEKLVVSKGTSGTHIANIYRKTNVHSQQELINLVDSFHWESVE